MRILSPLISPRMGETYMRTIPEYPEPALFDIYYNLEEEYYQDLASLMREKILLNEDVSSALKSVFEKLLSKSYKFAHYIKIHGAEAAAEIRAIKRMMEEDNLYPHSYYYIDDVIYEIPVVTPAMVESYDRVDYFKQCMIKPKLISQSREKNFYTRSMPTWLLNHSTTESLLQYIELSVRPSIKGKGYTVKELVPMIEEEVKKITEYFSTIRTNIEEINKRLNDTVERLNQLKPELKSWAKKTGKPANPVLREAKRYNDEYLYNAFMYLSAYWRASLMVYGNVYMVVSSAIHAMYQDTSEFIKNRRYNKSYQPKDTKASFRAFMNELSI